MAEDRAVAIKTKIVNEVETKIKQHVAEGNLQLPDGYSASNALKSAWLQLLEAKDKTGKKALDICTGESVANALMNMAIQGLNPAKNQCYFIVFGTKLVCMRSYFGSMAVASRVAGAKNIWAEVIYEGDEFEYEIRQNNKVITKHHQKLENIKQDKILAAYAVLEFDDRPVHTEIMTIEEIKAAWAQGQSYKENGQGTHQKFAGEMAKKVVINRACKTFIGASTDGDLVKDAFYQSEQMEAEENIDAEAEELANSQVIDIELDMPAVSITPDQQASLDDVTDEELAAGIAESEKHSKEKPAFA